MIQDGGDDCLRSPGPKRYFLNMNSVTTFKIYKQNYFGMDQQKSEYFMVHEQNLKILESIPGILTGYFIIFSAALFLSTILLISCIPKLSLFRFGLPRFPFFGVSIFSISILAFQLVHFEGEQPHTKIFCIILTQRQYKLPQFGKIQLTLQLLRVIYGRIKLLKISKVIVGHMSSF